jgi:hypothetical protein
VICYNVLHCSQEATPALVIECYVQLVLEDDKVTTPKRDTICYAKRAQVGYNMFAISTQVFKSNQW